MRILSTMHDNQHICIATRGDLDVMDVMNVTNVMNVMNISTLELEKPNKPDSSTTQNIYSENSETPNRIIGTAEIGTSAPILKTSRSRLRLPGILPRRLKKKSLSFTMDPKILNEFKTIFTEYDNDDSYHYCRKIVERMHRIDDMQRIGLHLGDEEIFSMLKFLLLEIEEPSNPIRQKDRSPYYSWVTFFYCLEYLPARFYNDNVDITALILLKCYEFLTLRTDNDVCLRNLQETLEHITDSVINKVSKSQRASLASEILAGNLPCSSQHQYDAASLNHYLLRVKDLNT